MLLTRLIHALDIRESTGNMDQDISDISYHSHRVKEGDLFVAIKGAKSDGHRFIGEAVTRGARALIVEKALLSPLDIPWIVVGDTRKALAQVSAEFFSYPSREIGLVGITGTNGKTTTSYLIESVLKSAGKKVGVIGTINYRFEGKELPASTTTPQSYNLQRLLREMVMDGAEYVVMEVSSHALDQERVRECDFDVGVFTNLSPEHLDYHEDMDRYFAVKRRFFLEILVETGKDPWAILNRDDPLLRGLQEELSSLRSMSYGLNQAGVSVIRHEVSLEGIHALLSTPTGQLTITTSLIGEYNLYNIMAATAVGVCLGVPLKTIGEGVARLASVPGRMERVGNGKPWILVDYAHTPDALEKAIRGVRGLAQGKLVVVFGCGGDRDKSKRAPMGRIGVHGTDLAIITSDNPRTEDPLEIIKEIEYGAKEVSSHRYRVIPDRREAIREAISLVGPQDVVLIAGKGHETYQIVGHDRVHFDDREEAKRVLEARG